MRCYAIVQDLVILGYVFADTEPEALVAWHGAELAVWVGIVSPVSISVAESATMP